jgi:hypothetical protein
MGCPGKGTGLFTAFGTATGYNRSEIICTFMIGYKTIAENLAVAIFVGGLFYIQS